MRKLTAKDRVKRAVLVPSGPWQVIDSRKRPVCDTDICRLRIETGVQTCARVHAELLIVSGNPNEMDRLELETLAAIRSAGYRPASVLYQTTHEVRMNTFMNVFLAYELAFAWRIEGIIMIPSPYQDNRMMLVAEGIRKLMNEHLQWDLRVHSVPCPLSTVAEVIDFEQALAEQEGLKCEIERGTLQGFAAELKGWRRGKKQFLPIPACLARVVPETITRTEQTVSSS